MKFVIDTNVAIVANGRKDDLPSDIPKNCINESIEKIKNVTEKNYCLVVDAADEIFYEYIKSPYLSLRGQPGIGDKFVKWVHDHQFNPSKVARVEITKSGSSYKEFPDHPDLHNV